MIRFSNFEQGQVKWLKISTRRLLAKNISKLAKFELVKNIVINT